MMNRSEADILKQRELWRQAVEEGNVDRIMSFYVKGAEYVGFDIMPPIQFVGWEAFRQNWIDFFKLFESKPTYEFKNLRVTCEADLAFVHGFTRFRGKMYGQHIDTWTRETNCLRKVGGQWLLAHDHISFPVDLSTGKAAMTLKP